MPSLFKLLSKKMVQQRVRAAKTVGNLFSPPMGEIKIEKRWKKERNAYPGSMVEVYCKTTVSRF